MTTRDELLQSAWGRRETHRDRTVDVFVRRLREKIDRRASQHTFIQTATASASQARSGAQVTRSKRKPVSTSFRPPGLVRRDPPCRSCGRCPDPEGHREPADEAQAALLLQRAVEHEVFPSCRKSETLLLQNARSGRPERTGHMARHLSPASASITSIECLQPWDAGALSFSSRARLRCWPSAWPRPGTRDRAARARLAERQNSHPGQLLADPRFHRRGLRRRRDRPARIHPALPRPGPSA